MKKKNTNRKADGRSTHPVVKRRSFFKLMGGGIFVFFSTWDPAELMASSGRKLQEGKPDFNAYLRIDENGIVS